MKFELNQKTVGSLLVGFSLILLFILIWVKVNVDTEQSFLCKVVEDRPDLTMDQCPAHDSNTSWLLLAGFGIAFLVLVSGFYMLFATQKIEAASAKKEKREEIDLSDFNEEEKKIYKLLQLNQGSMYQSDLIKETGLTKVKMSRLLDKLEGKGFIDRKRRGMTNIVVLK